MIAEGTEKQGDKIVTVKAVVFDAYGTLYDIQSVAAMTEQAFPGYGETVTQIWRIKQLEYTWLRSLMGRYESFWTVTRDSLEYTLSCLGLKDDGAFFDRVGIAAGAGQCDCAGELSGYGADAGAGFRQVSGRAASGCVAAAIGGAQFAGVVRGGGAVSGP